MQAQLWMDVDRSAALASAMHAFTRHCERRVGRDFPTYAALHRWASDDYEAFWRLFLEWSQLETEGDAQTVVTVRDCERARFFPDVRLNYARNLLRSRAPEWELRPALTGVDESGARVSLTRAELRQQVERCAYGLASLGVGQGDRVVAIVRNTPDAIVACLACAALGAMWSSVAPDLGEAAIIGRFAQLSPSVLFTHLAYTAHGVRRALHERVTSVARACPTLRALVHLDAAEADAQAHGVPTVSIRDLMSRGALALSDWRSWPFEQPLFVLFSSGTTGAPKCLMHGAGGTLLEHYKEHVLHSSLGPGEKLYFQTAAGWMMWNWQLSALASGAEIVLYDGSPTFPTQDALLRMLERERVSVFGTSATYLHALQQLGVSPSHVGTFEALHTIQSTGSILFDAQFDWLQSAFPRVRVQSISGGTDIVGCFVLGAPTLPIYRGESQCISLGLDVRVRTEAGVERAGEGELVCLNPFPSRPVGIYGDEHGERFHQTYFAQNPGMWTHGDQVRLSEHGSARILGRSDGTLNVRGVRIGPAEIYAIVLAIPGIVQALAVEQEAPREPGGSRLVLLVSLQEGVALDRALTLRIKKELSQKGSANHVPQVIVQVASLPTTHSGKLSERAVRDALNGRASVNRAALRNPDSIDEIMRCAELRLSERDATVG